jgi:SAM-dependent methyltransferase/uncharacterized protein YbaR (Trm112 family)
MQIALLDVLRCPLSSERLKLEIEREARIARGPDPRSQFGLGDPSERDREIISGSLIADQSGYRYPIIAGVPRMIVDPTLPDPISVNRQLRQPDASLSDEYQQTVRHFRTQWEAFGEEEKSFGMSVQETWKYLRETLSPPGLPDDWISGKVVVDAGCGHGKYVDALSHRGAEVIGMDITPEIERVYKRIGARPNVHLVQANILYPPLERARVDFVVSSGVIHHTPDTRAAFRAISKLVRSGGYLSIWVYPYRSAAFETVSQSIRIVTTRLPRPLLRALCYLPVPLLALPRWGAYSGTSLKSASWRQCAQVIYDFFGPKYQTHHRPDEIAAWYREEGFGQPWFGPNELSAVGRRLN